ncbi:isochorismatase family protein [bacterium]|nr:isochorismatase family protein [bacterium]MCI0602242.1 isochorismatase family protein [bacterium]
MDNEKISQSLIEAEDSVLIIIDVQNAFLDKLPVQESELLLSRVCWLIAVAQWKQIPLIVTAEEIHKQPLAPKLIQYLPADAPIFDKVSFGLAHQQDILTAVEQTGRKTAVLIGLETDVCVAHSAIGLLDQGYRVAVVADATGAPAPGQEIALSRMQNAGTIIVSTKSLFYEWMRTVEMVNRFHRECPNMRDVPGIVL